MRATAFGLDIECDEPLAFLQGTNAPATGRTVKLTVARAGATEWPRDSKLLCTVEQRDGTPVFQIHSDPDRGYQISGPRYGRHVLSNDGKRLTCDPGDIPDPGWQRLLVAQALPFAALLQGLEVLHASAVDLRGRAIAFLGPSGSGKTSLALETCAAGAHFLADDVVALQRTDTQLLAHPGTALAGVARSQDAEPTDAVSSDERERVVRVEASAKPVPLSSMFFLDRRADGPRMPSLEPLSDPQLLLSATFNFVLASPERLLGLLEVAALASRLDVQRVRSGPTTSVAELAEVVQAHLREPG